MTFNRKEHWEKIYTGKTEKEVSWYQQIPETSLEFLKQFNIPLTAKIIDVGGGDSYLADHLLEMGYQDITVLDISSAAIERIKRRLGDKASKIKWVVADITEFVPEEKYDFWHDRAAFHFLNAEADIDQYLETASSHLTDNGILVLGTFSVNGPQKCSGIEVRQYSEKSMSERIADFFQKIKCITVDHITPFNTVQNFIFCSFRRIAV